MHPRELENSLWLDVPFSVIIIRFNEIFYVNIIYFDSVAIAFLSNWGANSTQYYLKLAGTASSSI